VSRRGGRRHGRRRRHWLPWVLSVLLLGLAGAAVIAATGWHDLQVARSQLEDARSGLDQVGSDPSSLANSAGRAAAEQQIAAATSEVEQARHVLRRSPALTLAAVLPVLHTQRTGVLRLVDDSLSGTTIGDTLLHQMDGLATQLQVRSGEVPLAAVAQLQADARTAGDGFATLVRRPGGLWSSLASGRSQFNGVASRFRDRLLSAADDLGAARTFMGAGGTRSYFLAIENNAEMRDQGMVLDYATLTLSGGHLSFGASGRITDLALTTAAPTSVPPQTQAYFGYMRLTQLWQSVNTSADFSFSGRAMVDMYAQKTGQHLDGVIAIDVPGLADLLNVIGPVSVPGVAQPITAANAGTVLLHDFYSADTTPGEEPRHQEVLGVASQVISRLSKGQFDAVALGRALSRASAGGHVMLYSADPTEERVFEATGLGGTPAAVDPKQTFHIAVESRLATKMDYYIQPHVQQTILLTHLGTAIVKTTVTVVDTAPVGALPSLQLGPDPTYAWYAKDPGDYIAWVLCWGPAGSIQSDSGSESGLELSQQAPLVHAGGQVVAQFDTIIPNAVIGGRLALRYVPQPRLDPMGLDVTLDAPGWAVGASSTWQGPWDRTRTLSWSVHRR
jgi:cell division protein FtsB